MTVVLQIIFYVIVALLLLGVLLFVGRAFQARSQRARAAYGFDDLESQQAMRRNLLWSFLLLAGGLLCIGLFLLSSQLAALLPEPTAVPTATPLPSPTPSPTSLPLPTATAVTVPTATPTTPAAAADGSSPTPEIVATETAVSQPTTATVSSGVGVWLRSAPGTASDQLEYLLDGTQLTLLDSPQQTADELLWQQVVAPSGVTGWVATDFIVLNQ